MEQAAERKPHFGIRKLTIGAASVLLGTSLWMGVTASNPTLKRSIMILVTQILLMKVALLKKDQVQVMHQNLL